MPPVELPDAETMAVAFLNGRGGGVLSRAATKVPNPRPKRFTRAWRTGGAARNRVIDEPIITITCTASDSVTASADANAARNYVLNEYTRMPLVRHVEEVTGVHFDPDPDTGEDRYTFSVRMVVRGRPR